MTYTKLELNTVFGNGGWDEKLHQTLLLAPGETENHVVNLHPEIEYQKWEGFGGAMTEAADERDTKARADGGVFLAGSDELSVCTHSH